MQSQPVFVWFCFSNIVLQIGRAGKQHLRNMRERKKKVSEMLGSLISLNNVHVDIDTL